MELRDYQLAALGELRQSMKQGSKAPLLVSPCGSGKTLISAAIVESAVQKGSRVLCLLPRRELVYQLFGALDSFGIDAGIIMSGENRSLMPDVQIASLPTLHRRCVVGGAQNPPADLILVDESHTMMGKMMQDVLALYPGVRMAGQTATPARSDGRGLGELYDAMVEGPTIAELTKRGYLTPVRYYAPSKADLSDVRMQAGDYHQGDLGRAMNAPKLVGDVVDNWLRICPDRKTVIFAVDRKHAMALHEAFSNVGVASEYLDGNTPRDERHAVLDRIQSGASQVICSVDVLSYGWDCPSISCGIIARPTKSIARYLQSAGRILRPYPGQTDTILIDHSGVVEDLGFLDDPQPWSLDGKEKIQERKEKEPRKEPDPITCPECHAVIQPAPVCPECGHSMQKQYAKAIEAKEAELVEVSRSGEKANNKDSWETKQRFIAGVRSYARTHNYKESWVSHTYRARYGVWPNDPRVKNQPAGQLDEVTRRWIKHRQIKFAKHKKAMNKSREEA